MSDERTRFRLVREHTLTDHDYHEWVNLAHGDAVYRDAIGRSHRFAYHCWILLVCNNTECAGRALYRADVVDQAAAEWEARRSRAGTS